MDRIIYSNIMCNITKYNAKQFFNIHIFSFFRSDLPMMSYSTDENVYTRLAAHIEVLASRGVKTESMWPHWCSQNPGKCL